MTLIINSPLIKRNSAQAMPAKVKNSLPVIFLIACFIIGFHIVNAQNIRPIDYDIHAFVAEDSINPPLPGTSLFTGSSSIRMWHDLESYFPGLALKQRGFGGSTIADLIYYADQIILPYQWKQIVIYSGENDLSFNPQMSPDTLLSHFERLFRLIRAYDENVPVFFISLKPSADRWEHHERFLSANEKINHFLKQQANSFFVDVWPLLLNAEGTPDSSLFLSDGLHLNQKGYLRWANELKKYLIQ